MAAVSNVFRREGEYWTVVFDGLTCHLRDIRGLRILAILLSRPGERVRAGELVSPATAERATEHEPAAAERARVRATRAIRAALRKLECQLPVLGVHLEATVRTGHECVYLPDPRVPIVWEVGVDRDGIG